MGRRGKFQSEDGLVHCLDLIITSATPFNLGINGGEDKVADKPLSSCWGVWGI